MEQQGRCMLPADETRRVLDRLAALEKVISPTDIRQALKDTGRVNPRACKLTHEIMMWVVLSMGIFTKLPIRQVFKQARCFRVTEETPCRSALCVARQRLGVEPLRRLFERTVRPLATPETPGAFYCGFFSYKLWKSVVFRGIHLLARLSKGMLLKKIEQFSDGSYLAKIYANARNRKRDRGGILVRVIKYRRASPHRISCRPCWKPMEQPRSAFAGGVHR